MKSTLVDYVIRFPKIVYTLISVVVLFFMLQIPALDIDTDPENMLAPTNVDRSYHNQVKRQFALHDSMVLGIVNNQGIYNPQSLALVDQVTQYLLSLDGVIKQDVIAPSVVDNIYNQDQGVIRFEWLMKQPPATQVGADKIANAISRLPLLNSTMISSDHQAIAIFIPLTSKTMSYQLAEQIRAYVAPLSGEHQFYISGLPVAEDQFGREMFVQMAISAPLAGVMIFFMMWLLFRNVTLIVAPMLVALATVIITMGLLIALGFKVHILSSMIAIFLMPIAVVDSIHIMSEFSDRYRTSNQTAAQVITQVVRHLFRPMLFTSITSAVGFFSLMLTPIPPVKIFGGFVGFGILLAFVLTMVLLPAYLSRLSPSALAKLKSLRVERTSPLERRLDVIRRLSIGYPRLIVGITLLIGVISYFGINQITINDNPVRWFKQDHQIRIADKVLNQHFAGTYNAYLVLSRNDQVAQQALFAQQLNQFTVDARALDLNLALPLPPVTTSDNLTAALNQWTLLLDDYLFEFDSQLTQQQMRLIQHQLTVTAALRSSSASFYQPQMLRYIEQLEQALLSSPIVGNVNSLPDLVKTVNRELVSGQAQDFVLPATSNGVAQVLMQYQSSHRPNDLWHFVTRDQQASLLWLQLKSGDNQSMQQVMALVEQYVTAHPLPANIDLKWAGKAYINVVWQQEMVAGMLNSLASAFVVVLLMMMALFKSVRYGLLAMLPLTITIGLIYGLIGWVGKDYDMPIAVLSSLTLGLSVDFAIHFIERYRQLLTEGHNSIVAINLMFKEPAQAISRNAIVIACGFTPLLFAPLVPYITVGLFLASIMVISAIITLMLVPAIITLANSPRPVSKVISDAQSANN